MLLSVNSLDYQYSPGNPIFQNLTWSISPGERWAVLGPSGCGKSTLLLLLAGILKAIAGEIRIKDSLITRPRPQTGLVLQNYGLLPWATVQENYELGLKLRRFYGPDGVHAPSQRNGNQSINWLEKLGIEKLKDRYPSQISGGQQQRTAIARTLSLDPDLLLMDEPFGSLDAPTTTELQDLLIDLNVKHQIALVFVTHSVETAAVVGEKILLLGNPPNISPQIITNPNSGTAGYKDSDEMQKLTKQLRIELERSR